MPRPSEVRGWVAAIATEEGFVINARKTALMTRAGRQRVCGIVVNEHPNVMRGDYDELKAIRHNAARDGPAAANRTGVTDFRAHLLGRIAWVESLNPFRGTKLRRPLRADRVGRLSASVDLPQLSAQRGQNDPRSYRLALVYETCETTDEALPRAGSIADFGLT